MNTKEIEEKTALSVLTESYLRYYAAGKDHTARAKRLDVAHFIRFLVFHRGKKQASELLTEDWDLSSVNFFTEERLRRGESPATVTRRLATIKHMGRTLSERIPGFINPAKDARPPKVKIATPKGIEPEQMREIHDRAKARILDRNSFGRVRNQMLFKLLIDTGLRADEVRLLRFGQLADELDWLKEVRTKGKRYRNVYLTSQLRDDLRLYMKARELELKRFYPKLSQKIDQSLPIFLSTYGASAADPDSFFMGAKSIWRAIRELSVDAKLHPHLLRHSFALELLDSSRDIRLVAQALGHGDVKVTMRYTEQSELAVARALEKTRNRK